MKYITWVYASIQGIVVIIVSIIGAKYVRNVFLLQKSTLKQNIDFLVETIAVSSEHHQELNESKDPEPTNSNPNLQPELEVKGTEETTMEATWRIYVTGSTCI